VRKRFLLVLVAFFVSGASSLFAAVDPGPLVCETFYGCRKATYPGGAYCRCDSTHSCTECCVVDTADCYVSEY